jgi:mRNA-degrading endonuclease YafQ of YafQ-DinJ toxin-antitoxin module
MYRFQASETFWKKFYRLSSDQKESVRRVWAIFKSDPFDARLGTHKINNLSARFRKTIYSVVIEADLRAIFYIENDVICTVDISTHSVYR